ncbi:MAG: hypothetical protein ABII12_13245 [Planctomycetota bacterium]
MLDVLAQSWDGTGSYHNGRPRVQCEVRGPAGGAVVTRVVRQAGKHGWSRLKIKRIPFQLSARVPRWARFLVIGAMAGVMGGLAAAQG